MKRKRKSRCQFGRWKVRKVRVKTWAEDCDRMFYDPQPEDRRRPQRPEMK